MDRDVKFEPEWVPFDCHGLVPGSFRSFEERDYGWDAVELEGDKTLPTGEIHDIARNTPAFVVSLRRSDRYLVTFIIAPDGLCWIEASEETM